MLLMFVKATSVPIVDHIIADYGTYKTHQITAISIHGILHNVM